MQKSTSKSWSKSTGSSENACNLNPAQHPNDVWSYDFLFDQTSNGSTLKVLVVIDEFTRLRPEGGTFRCLSLKVERKLKHQDVITELERLFRIYSTPKRIRSDNGSEFTAQNVQTYFETHNLKSLHIALGSPWQNGTNGASPKEKVLSSSPPLPPVWKVLTINFGTITSVAKELSLLNRELFYTLKEAKHLHQRHSRWSLNNIV